MTREHAKKIVEYAVRKYKKRWLTYDGQYSWDQVEELFLQRAHEQGGFASKKFLEVAGEEHVRSIREIGTILAGAPKATGRYDPDYARFDTAPLYTNMREGRHGPSGKAFATAVRRFLEERRGKPGRCYWMQLWRMLCSCAYLVEHHSGSFAVFLKERVAQWRRCDSLTDEEFLNMRPEQWQTFVAEAKPHLPGVGADVLDYIMAGIKKATFASGCFKLDSANKHFLAVTGIIDLISPTSRRGIMGFLDGLKLPYTLRAINAGLYTYCAMGEMGNCRNRKQCERCEVNKLCDKRLHAVASIHCLCWHHSRSSRSSS